MNRRAFLMTAAGPLVAAGVPAIDKSLGPARVWTGNGRLIATTGAVERQWLFTESGLATCSLKDVARGRQWVASPKHACDWHVPGLTGGPARIESIEARESDDEGFTSRHLEAVVTVAYLRARVSAQYVIWLYPGAEGIRTQLRFRALEGFAAPSAEGEGTVERYALDIPRLTRRAVSYSKHNTARADRYEQHPMMRERLRGGAPDGREVYDFTSFLSLEDARGCLAVVKESPVVDSPVRGTTFQKPGSCAYRVGAFVCDERGMEVTGAGISATDVVASEWRPGWATWTVAAGAGAAELQRAMKMFDRLRFPLDPSADLYIGANNWGSTENPQDGKKSSAEGSILREIDAAAEMGIEVVQIDDGWQARPDWQCDPNAYPRGWADVKGRAAEKGVLLGLWCDGDAIPLDTLLAQVDAGGFRCVKFDFYDMSTYAKVADMRHRARTLVRHCGGHMRVNWDTTGTNSKDQGMFYGREYGSLWYQNQKQHLPDHVLYRPWRVLRDAWHLAHYVNLSKLQIPIQNPEAAYPPESDAGKHSQGYATAIALMGCPNYFQELKYLSPRARQEIRQLLKLYKKARPELARCYVYPAGSRPDNASWTGFQAHDHATGRGFLMLFRELHNGKPEERIALSFLARRSLAFTDLATGEKWTGKVGEDGRAVFRIGAPAQFRFLRYA